MVWTVICVTSAGHGRPKFRGIWGTGPRIALDKGRRGRFKSIQLHQMRPRHFQTINGQQPAMQARDDIRPKPGESHHARIITSLREAIIDGSMLPGHQLPKEIVLAEQFGVSRMTMNKVLTRLTTEGYLVRRKRSGTFVAQPRGQSAVMEITDIAQEVGALGLVYAWRLDATETRPLVDAERALLDMPEDVAGGTLVIEGVHLARGKPFCRELRAINLVAVPDASTQDFAQVVPGQWLLHSMPFSAATHRVRAITAAGPDARGLGVPSGTACLEILRKTRIEQAWVTHVRLLYPGEMHQLVADFTPRNGIPTGISKGVAS